MHPRHSAKRTIVIALLAAGTVLGYGAGFFSMARRGHHRKAAFENHVAQLCVDAAARPRRPAAAEGSSCGASRPLE